MQVRKGIYQASVWGRCSPNMGVAFSRVITHFYVVLIGNQKKTTILESSQKNGSAHILSVATQGRLTRFLRALQVDKHKGPASVHVRVSSSRACGASPKKRSYGQRTGLLPELNMQPKTPTRGICFWGKNFCLGSMRSKTLLVKFVVLLKPGAAPHPSTFFMWTASSTRRLE